MSGRYLLREVTRPGLEPGTYELKVQTWNPNKVVASDRVARGRHRAQEPQGVLSCVTFEKIRVRTIALPLFRKTRVIVI